MTVPATANLPVGGDERNLLVDPVSGHYRLTKEGFDVRTADPDVNPEQFEFSEDTLSADIVLATGSFVPSSQDLNDIQIGVDHTDTTQIIMYPRVGDRYYFRPAMKGEFRGGGLNPEETYSTDRQAVVFSQESGPAQLRFESATVFTIGSNSWSRDAGFYQLQWQNEPLIWVQINMAGFPAPPSNVPGQRFKVRSLADGGGMMLAKLGKNLTSTDPDDYIIHPDKRTLQFVAEFIVTIPANSSVTLPLPAGVGKPVPVIFVAGTSSYIQPFIRRGFAIAQATFEYVSGGVLFNNEGGSSDNRFHVAFLNVQMP